MYQLQIDISKGVGP